MKNIFTYFLDLGSAEYFFKIFKVDFKYSKLLVKFYC